MLQCTDKTTLIKNTATLFTWTVGSVESINLGNGYAISVNGNIFLKNIADLKGHYICQTGVDDRNKKEFHVYKTTITEVSSLTKMFSINYGANNKLFLNSIECKFDDTTDGNNCKNLITKKSSEFVIEEDYVNSKDDVYILVDFTTFLATTYKLIQSQSLLAEFDEVHDLSRKCANNEALSFYGVGKQTCTRTLSTDCNTVGITITDSTLTLQNGKTVWLLCKTDKYTYTKQLIHYSSTSSIENGKTLNLYTIGSIKIEITCTDVNGFTVMNQNIGVTKIVDGISVSVGDNNRYTIETSKKTVDAQCGTTNSVKYHIIKYDFAVTRDGYKCPSNSVKDITVNNIIKCTDTTASYMIEITMQTPGVVADYYIEHISPITLRCSVLRIGSLSKCLTSNKVPPCFDNADNNAVYTLRYSNLLLSSVTCDARLIMS